MNLGFYHFRSHNAADEVDHPALVGEIPGDEDTDYSPPPRWLEDIYPNGGYRRRLSMPDAQSCRSSSLSLSSGLGGNISSITIETEASERDSYSLMCSKMIESTPTKALRFLQLCAFLGLTFDVKTVELLWSNRFFSARGTKPDASDMTVNQLLDLAVTGGYLAPGTSRYRWSSNAFREIALASIKQGRESLSFQFEMGVTLSKKLSEAELRDNIYVVANLLNAQLESIAAAGGSTEIARLNLIAATKALAERRSPQLEVASKHATAGIRVLPGDCWETIPDLSLDLYSTGAEIEGRRGNLEDLVSYSYHVVYQPRCSTLDKLRVYRAEMSCLAQKGRTNEAIRICLDVLEQLDCKFPRGRILRFCRALGSCKAIPAKSFPITERVIESLPPMSDPDKIACMELMDQLVGYCSASKQRLLRALVISRQTQWTLKFGRWAPLFREEWVET